MNGRRTEIAVQWEGRDITRDLAPHLLGLSYTDNLSGAADDLSFELEDRDALWVGDWRPSPGDKVVATITAEPWLTMVRELRLGTFAHDKITLEGPPRRASLRCVSAPLATGLRRRQRTRSWARVTLRQIAQDIADQAKLSLMFDAQPGRPYTKSEQNNESDLEFLTARCEEQGLALKVTEESIAVFDEQRQEQSASVGTVELGGGGVLSWSFEVDDSARYGSAHITFFDPRSGKKIEAEYKDPSNSDGQTLELKLAADSAGHASDRAKALLRAANRFASRGRLSVLGDPGLVAGVVFDLAGAGSLDGKFIVTKAEHRPVGGYTCALEVRRVLEGY